MSMPKDDSTLAAAAAAAGGSSSSSRRQQQQQQQAAAEAAATAAAAKTTLTLKKDEMSTDNNPTTNTAFILILHHSQISSFNINTDAHHQQAQHQQQIYSLHCDIYHNGTDHDNLQPCSMQSCQPGPTLDDDDDDDDDADDDDDSSTLMTEKCARRKLLTCRSLQSQPTHESFKDLVVEYRARCHAVPSVRSFTIVIVHKMLVRVAAPCEVLWSQLSCLCSGVRKVTLEAVQVEVDCCGHAGVKAVQCLYGVASITVYTSILSDESW
eukprot:2390004-Amphidinium_carterae.1